MLKLNLGCGEDYQESYINVDVRKECNPDIICDLSKGFNDRPATKWGKGRIPIDLAEKDAIIAVFDYNNDTLVDEILANDFLEHIEQDKILHLIDEIWRVLRPDGLFRFRIPSTDGRGAFQDPTHRSFWNINSWLYWTNDQMRQQIGAKAKFQVEILNDQPTGLGVIHTFGLLRAVK